jgi:hypothetical protein
MTPVFPFRGSPEHVPFDDTRTRIGAQARAPHRVPRLRVARPASSSRLEVLMDALVNQLARELADAIAAAVAEDSRVEACREKARQAGLDMQVSLEAVIGFVDRANANTPGAGPKAQTKRPANRQFDMTANDRRFLKSLRIAADEEAKKEVE